MTLYDLMSSMTLQGNIEIRVMNDDGEAVKTEYFDSVDDLECCEIFRLEDMENLEVQYMYAENACMVIELEETEDRNMNKTNCKTGAKISSHNVPILVEWKCPCCFHRWWEDANALEYPEACPLCGVSLEDTKE